MKDIIARFLYGAAATTLILLFIDSVKHDKRLDRLEESAKFPVILVVSNGVTYTFTMFGTDFTIKEKELKP